MVKKVDKCSLQSNWRSTLTYFAIKFLVKTFDFRSFFLHCQKGQFDELGKLANIVTRFSNTEEI